MRRSALTGIMFVAAALWLMTPARALACTCMMSGPPCQAAWTADVVFAGTVRGSDDIQHETLGAPYQSRLVRFDVDTGFINAQPGPVEVVTGLGGGDCGYAFEAGKRYLVYAWRRGARLFTGICSRTRLFAEAAEDVRYLSALPASRAGARVYGRVKEWRRDPAEQIAIDYGPLEGIPVNVRGASYFKEVLTDAHGRFEIVDLPVGKATLTVVPPFGYDSRYVEREFEIRDLRACSEIDVALRQVASASGTVVDASGRPLADVSVDAVAAELAGFAPPQFHQPAETDAAGAFRFDDLPPGTYVFGINLTQQRSRRFSAPVFLPGTAVAREASRIELKAGDRKDVGVLRVDSQ